MFFSRNFGVLLDFFNEAIIGGIPGIDPHRLFEMDPAEMVEALDVLMQCLETLEVENHCLRRQSVVSESQAGSSEKTPSSDPVIPLQHDNRKLRQWIRYLRQQNGSCGCQTEPASPSADFVIANQLERENQNLRQKLEAFERENHRSVTPFSMANAKKLPKAWSQTGTRKVSP